MSDEPYMDLCWFMSILCWLMLIVCWFIPCQIILIYVDIMLIYVDLCVFPYILSEGFLCVFRLAGHLGYGGYVDFFWFYIDFKLISCWLMYPTKVLRHRSLICWFILIFFCFLVDSMLIVADFVLIFIDLFDLMMI